MGWTGQTRVINPLLNSCWAQDHRADSLLSAGVFKRKAESGARTVLHTWMENYNGVNACVMQRIFLCWFLGDSDVVYVDEARQSSL